MICEFAVMLVTINYYHCLYFIPDIDECTTLSPCHENAECFDLEPGFECACKEGYFGTGIYCEGDSNKVDNRICVIYKSKHLLKCKHIYEYNTN